MKEYTILVVLSSILYILLDRKLKTNFLKQKIFWLFLAIIAGFKLIINGYLTANIVRYNSSFNLNIRIGTIPIEDFLFGFSMIMFTLIIWEKLKENK
ncbi:MAG: lycopene cyclase domain-containing protein [Candidatus Riflemargulisbacteria bacterium]